MTEDEAKTKWCPFVRSFPESEGFFPMTTREEKIGDKGRIVGESTRCIGSACMAWRNNSTEVTIKPTDGEQFAFAQKIGFKQDPHYENQMIRDGGYCGLAGRP